PAGNAAGSAGALVVRQPNVWDAGAGSRNCYRSSRVARDYSVAAGAAHPATNLHTWRRLAGSFARRFPARPGAGHHAGADGLDVSDADYLSGVDRAGTLPPLHQPESLHRARPQLSPHLFGRARARLVKPRLLRAVSCRYFCVWLLVVREKPPYLRRCDLASADDLWLR